MAKKTKHVVLTGPAGTPAPVTPPANTFGAWRQVVPVVSAAMDDIGPVEPVPPPPVLPPGDIWGKPAQFDLSAANPPTDTGPASVPVDIKNPAKITHECRIESLQDADMWKTADYTETFVGHDQVTGSSSASENRNSTDAWEEAWIYLGSETQHEIVGVTVNKDGSTTERFQDWITERYLHMTFTKRPGPPNFGGGGQTFGGLKH